MRKGLWCVFTGLCALLTVAAGAGWAGAQTAEVKPKPAMYSYIANWQVPHEHFADMGRALTSATPILEKAMSDGTLVGYGHDLNLVHTPTNETHDTWWSAMSMAGLVKVLDQLMKSEVTPNAAMPTKHWDEILVSHYYNWKPGSYTDGYVHVSEYKVKADAPDDAVDMLSQHLIVPALDKLVADGTIAEYEIDETAIHTSAPGTFAIVYVAPKAEGLDTTQAAIRSLLKEHPLGIQAFGYMTEDAGHRDELMEGSGTFK